MFTPQFDRAIELISNFPKGVIVFDRDDTIVFDAGQHNDIEKLFFLPGAFEAIKLLKENEFGIAIASNQSGIASRKFPTSKLWEFNSAMCKDIFRFTGVNVDLIAVCAHSPQDNCGCRKPATGLLKAIEETGLGKIKAFVGNSPTDQMAAVAYSIEYVDVSGGGIHEAVRRWLESDEDRARSSKN